MSDEVVVELNGGLGNQLWGWAAAYALAKKLDLALVLDCAGLHQRRFQLSSVDTGATLKRNLGINYLPAAQTINRFVDRQLPSRRMEVFEESGFSFDRRFRQIVGPTRLRGYFQSPNYFSGFGAAIRARILTEKNLALRAGILDELGLPEQFLAVHVRLGDYKHSRHVFPALGTDYFADGISMVREVVADSEIVVFTDSIAESKTLFPRANRYIGPADLPRAFDNVLAMTKARGIVGSNSSFSWWAAYLMESEDGTRIFPKKWFQDPTISVQELILTGWRTL